jgi:hypothetical protein
MAKTSKIGVVSYPGLEKVVPPGYISGGIYLEMGFENFIRYTRFGIVIF